MKRLHDRFPILFAWAWILLYCAAPPLLQFWSRRFGAATAHLMLASAAMIFLLSCRLAGYYGLTCRPRPLKPWYLIPFLVLVTGNLWGGIRISLSRGLAVDAGDMVLVGFLEELLFRGFLYRGLRSRLRPQPAVILAALLFGLIHGANLVAGQGLLPTVLQILFAVAGGFLFTMVYDRSGSLLPCIVTHALVNVFSLLSANGPALSMVYLGAAAVVSAVCCVGLARLPSSFSEANEGVGPK